MTNFMSLYYIQKYYDKFKGYCLKRQKNNINGTVGSPAIKIIVFVLFALGVGRKIDFSLSEKLFANIVIIFWISWFFFYMVRDFLANGCIEIMNNQPSISPKFGKAVRDYVASFDFILIHFAVSLFLFALMLRITDAFGGNVLHPLILHIIMAICIVVFSVALIKMIFEYIRYAQFIQYKTIGSDKYNDPLKGLTNKAYRSISKWVIFDNLYSLSVEILLIIIVSFILIGTSIIDESVELVVSLVIVSITEIIGFIMFKFTYDRLITDEPEIIFNIPVEKSDMNMNAY